MNLLPEFGATRILLNKFDTRILRNQNFAKWICFLLNEPKVIFCTKLSNLAPVRKKLIQLKRVTDVGLMRSNAQPGFCEEGGGLKPKVNFFAQKLSHLGFVLNKLTQLKLATDGTWGRSPQPMGKFCNLRDKLAILITFLTFFKSYE